MRLVACLILSLGWFAHACAGLEIDGGVLPASNDYSWYEVLVDAERSHSLDDLIRLGPNAGFRAASARDVNLGYTNAQVWAHFSLRNATSDEAPLTLVLPVPLADDVELSSVGEDGQMRHWRTGDSRPFSSRAIDYRAFAFELRPPPGTRVDYYLRVRGEASAVSVPLRIMSVTAFDRFRRGEYFFLGAYFGIMSALAIAALVIYFTFRQRVFLDYFFYISTFTLTLLAFSGTGMQMLWPQLIAVQQSTPTVMAALAIATGVAFVRNMLTLKLRWPSVDRALLFAAFVAVGGAAWHLLVSSRVGSMTAIVAALALCPLAGVAFTRFVIAGDRLARYFLLGWLAGIAGILAAGLAMLGVIAPSTLSAYGLFLGSFAQFVALSLALGDRLHEIQREKAAHIARTSYALAELNLNLEKKVAERTAELEKRNDDLAELAVRDSLTCPYNHSTSIELVEQILSQSQRYGFAVSVLMIDIDHFKQVNDNNGHQVGDAAIEIIAQTLLDAARDSDVVGRYGGEEFVIAMPHADAVAAREFGERILEKIRRIALPQPLRQSLSVSIGIAVSSARAQRVDAAELIHRADQALYRSKRDGRDRLTLDSLTVVGTQSDWPGESGPGESGQPWLRDSVAALFGAWRRPSNSIKFQAKRRSWRTASAETATSLSIKAPQPRQ